jgi:hypothetical protein
MPFPRTCGPASIPAEAGMEEFGLLVILHTDIFNAIDNHSCPYGDHQNILGYTHKAVAGRRWAKVRHDMGRKVIKNNLPWQWSAIRPPSGAWRNAFVIFFDKTGRAFAGTKPLAIIIVNRDMVVFIKIDTLFVMFSVTSGFMVFFGSIMVVLAFVIIVSTMI